MNRKQVLIEKRNKAIVEKYYELFDVRRKRSDDVLRELSENIFYLDQKYIYAIIYYNKKYNEFYNNLVNKTTETSMPAPKFVVEKMDMQRRQLTIQFD